MTANLEEGFSFTPFIFLGIVETSLSKTPVAALREYDPNDTEVELWYSHYATRCFKASAAFRRMTPGVVYEIPANEARDTIVPQKARRASFTSPEQTRIAALAHIHAPLKVDSPSTALKRYIEPLRKMYRSANKAQRQRLLLTIVKELTS